MATLEAVVVPLALPAWFAPARLGRAQAVAEAAIEKAASTAGKTRADKQEPAALIILASNRRSRGDRSSANRES